MSCFLLTDQSLCATPQWYSGKVTRVWAYTGAFIITIDSNTVDDCKHKYIFFTETSLGKALKDDLYAMSLSAFHSSSNIGIVIDKEKNIDGKCYAMSMHVQK